MGGGHLTAPGSRVGSRALPPPIEIRELRKRFGSTVAVDGLTFDVGEGRIVGFLGPNGAGKTTTLRSLLGLIRPSAGEVLIEGRPFIEAADPARTVGAVLEVGAAHPGRSGRNHLRTLALASGLPHARVEEVLEMVDLAGAAGRRVGGYSLGMKQRLGLAAALLGNPRILVLDEPANGLDPAGIRWLRDLLRSLASAGHSILISSHVLSEVAAIADDAVVINHGRSVVQAPIPELTGGAAGAMRIAGPDAPRLAERLQSEGASVEPSGDGAFVVHGLSGEEIGRVVAESGLVIAELSPITRSLEDVFLELTSGEDEA
jgi:ABC-2 type transport system ATP-binding protein